MAAPHLSYTGFGPQFTPVRIVTKGLRLINKIVVELRVAYSGGQKRYAADVVDYRTLYYIHA